MFVSTGHAVVPCLLVGTNQGGIQAFTIDMPADKHRESKSPIVMPIGKAGFQGGEVPHFQSIISFPDPIASCVPTLMMSLLFTCDTLFIRT